MNIDTPITKQAAELCSAIEMLPASNQATALSIQASELGNAISELEHNPTYSASEIANLCRARTLAIEQSAAMRRLMIEASAEIKRLRRTVEVLRAKEEVLHIFARATGMREDGQVMATDIVWEIERNLAEQGKGASES